MTFLPAAVPADGSTLYLILDVYSRKIVGWEVHETDSSDYAVDLLRRTALAEGLHRACKQAVLHGYNGSTLKAPPCWPCGTGWASSLRTRARVSATTTPFVEALFRTAKYRPQFPRRSSLISHARESASSFVQWYIMSTVTAPCANVSPAQRHVGCDHEFLVPGTRCTSDQGPPIHLGGRGTHATGIRSRRHAHPNADALIESASWLRYDTLVDRMNQATTILTFTACPPVLFIIFKRPDTTLQVMEAIREARPARLYIAADGPRAGRDGEA